MRVAAVALVLVVGAAVVLAFANTLNTWVLGGLLGGLAALLLGIPISLAVFTLLARRHDARQRSLEPLFEDEPEFADQSDEASVIYDAEGYVLLDEEDAPGYRRSRPLPDSRHLPVSGHLALPPAGYRDTYDDDPGWFEHREPRNYPRQPRDPARLQDQGDEIASPPPAARSYRHPSTRSLAQHQSAARHQARQEAQQRSVHRSGSGSSARREQERPSHSTQHSRSQTSGSHRFNTEYDSHLPRPRNAQPLWNDDENVSDDLTTEQLRDRSRQYPRHPHTPRTLRSPDPRTDALGDQGGQHERRARRDPERISGTLGNPLVRRAPYLYEDDPLREEFAQQLDGERPITRRSSLYEHYEDEGER